MSIVFVFELVCLRHHSRISSSFIIVRIFNAAYSEIATRPAKQMNVKGVKKKEFNRKKLIIMNTEINHL